MSLLTLRFSTPVAVVLLAATVGATGCLPADWPTYHRDNRCTGLDPGFRPVNRLVPGWRRTLDGAVYASPVVAAGTLVVATENNGVYGFDPANGRRRWYRRLAPPVRLSRLAQLGAPCGNIDPLGVTGTPAYDPRTRRVFVVTESEERPGRIVHRLVGLDPASGAVRLSRPVPPPRGDPAAHQQRSALVIANGRVYVPYGGLAGDCGSYVGSVVAGRTDGTGGLDSFAAPALSGGMVYVGTYEGVVAVRGG